MILPGAAVGMAGSWHPDVLGEPYEQQTLPLGRDGEGELVATLVRRMPSALRRKFAEGRYAQA